MVKLKIVLHLSMGTLLNLSVEFPLIGQCRIAQDSAGSTPEAGSPPAPGPIGSLLLLRTMRRFGLRR